MTKVIEYIINILHFTLFTITFCITSSHAHSKLTPFTELPEVEQKRLKKLRRASFALDFKNKKCSGTYISNEGHLITANHCLGGCLENELVKQGFDPRLDNEKNLIYHVAENNNNISSYNQNDFRNYLIKSNRSDDKLKYIQTKSTTQSLAGLKCRARINGEEVILSSVAGGNGDVYPFLYDKRLDSSPPLKTLWRDYNISGHGAGGDFSVLKVEKENTPCLQLSMQDARNGEKLETLSSTLRRGYMHTSERNGQLIFYSSGNEATDLLRKYRSGIDFYPFRHAYLDGDYGSSGSSVVGEDGEIKGILIQALDIKEDGEKDYTFSTFLDISHITNLMKLSANFDIPNCEN